VVDILVWLFRDDCRRAHRGPQEASSRRGARHFLAGGSDAHGPTVEPGRQSRQNPAISVGTMAHSVQSRLFMTHELRCAGNSSLFSGATNYRMSSKHTNTEERGGAPRGTNCRVELRQAQGPWFAVTRTVRIRQRNLAGRGAGAVRRILRLTQGCKTCTSVLSGTVLDEIWQSSPLLGSERVGRRLAMARAFGRPYQQDRTCVGQWELTKPKGGSTPGTPRVQGRSPCKQKPGRAAKKFGGAHECAGPHNGGAMMHLPVFFFCD